MNIVAIFENASPAMAIAMVEGLKGQAEGLKLPVRFIAGPGAAEGCWDINAMTTEPLKPGTTLVELQAFAEGFACCWNNERT